MYYPCNENKGADQLRGYREADLRPCFRICKKPVFSGRGPYGNIRGLDQLKEEDLYVYFCGLISTFVINCFEFANSKFNTQTDQTCLTVINKQTLKSCKGTDQPTHSYSLTFLTTFLSVISRFWLAIVVDKASVGLI